MAFIDFKNRKWVIYGASGYPAYITPFAVVPSRKFVERYGISNEGVALWQGKIFDWLFDEAELIAFSEKVLPKLLEEQWKYYDIWRSEAEKFETLHYRLMGTDAGQISDTELLVWSTDYYEAFMAQYTINNFIEPVSFYFQSYLEQLLVKEGVGAEEAKRLMGIFGSPSKPNYIKQCVAEYREAKTDDDIQRVLQKFHYINNDYTGSRPFTRKDLEDISSKAPHAENVADAGVSLLPPAKSLLTVLQMTATVQDVRKADSLMWVSGAELLLREIAKRKGIDFDDMLFATWDEVVAGEFDLNILKERKNRCVVDWNSEGTKIYTGQDAEGIIEDFKKSILGSTEDIKEFKGTPASKGKVTGPAKVVLNVSQFHKVKEGDILVTVMTRPEYLPIMGIAAAFVTDEGGITCHAAIVAREMGKPCIIGTKIASKVLKDGDEVEVDADKGIVRIVKKL